MTRINREMVQIFFSLFGPWSSRIVLRQYPHKLSFSHTIPLSSTTYLLLFNYGVTEPYPLDLSSPKLQNSSYKVIVQSGVNSPICGVGLNFKRQICGLLSLFFFEERFRVGFVFVFVLKFEP